MNIIADKTGMSQTQPISKGAGDGGSVDKILAWEKPW